MSARRRLRAFFLEPIEGFLSRLEAILVTHLHFQRITMDQLQHLQQSIATLQSSNVTLSGKVDTLIQSHADLKRQLVGLANNGGASSEMLMSMANQIDGTNLAMAAEAAKVDAETAADAPPPPVEPPVEPPAPPVEPPATDTQPPAA